MSLDPSPSKAEQVVRAFVESIPDSLPVPTPLTDDQEIKSCIDSLPSHKAPGLDRISNLLLKHAASVPRFLSLSSNLFNSIYSSSYYPSAWKVGKVILIPKPGKDPTIPGNSRPITLLSNLSKILERILLKRLSSHAEESNIIRPEQLGFRERSSAIHHVLRLVEGVTRGFNVRRPTDAVFLDVARAFDRVWHDGLLYKLHLGQFPMPLISLLRSYLHDRKFRIAEGSSLSSLRPSEAGVPQGSLLSPLLFNIYVNDMPTHNKTTLYMYADDTAIASTCRSTHANILRLNTHLARIHRWTKMWKIQTTRTKAHTFILNAPKNMNLATL
jgi:hypothetical protein